MIDGFGGKGSAVLGQGVEGGGGAAMIQWEIQYVPGVLDLIEPRPGSPLALGPWGIQWQCLFRYFRRIQASKGVSEEGY